ncbi:MAG: DNA alkylation repair protein [Puniceicoccales bacterium]|jgi:3-methyladenine DNA glycosylase AlkD|nr:DNA alkylation repair protein [Puniceicoccales bacterium]
MSIASIIRQIKSCGNSDAAEQCKMFFQAQPGGYGAGDTFCGVNVPTLRKIAAANGDISLDVIEKLLQNQLHEARFVALVMLVEKFNTLPDRCIKIYLENTKFINNWDLVDMSTDKICGAYCLANNREDIIWELAKSDNLWENRMAIVASFAFIRDNKLQLTMDLCDHFLNHKHHLIHKACGWMLRELGKRDQNLLLQFVGTRKLPSITRSYALEIVKREQKSAQTKTSGNPTAPLEKFTR